MRCWPVGYSTEYLGEFSFGVQYLQFYCETPLRHSDERSQSRRYCIKKYPNILSFNI